MAADSLHSGTAFLTTGNDSDEVMSPRIAIERVRAAVATWAGITTHSHRFGGIEFRVGRRELGHLHRTIADLPFPRRIRDGLIAQEGQATSCPSTIRVGYCPDANRIGDRERDCAIPEEL